MQAVHSASSSTSFLFLFSRFKFLIVILYKISGFFFLRSLFEYCTTIREMWWWKGDSCCSKVIFLGLLDVWL
jgi:hypothetical protein